MLLPQVITFLLPRYGFQGTILIISSIMLNGVPAALLFQPVKWHMKIVDNESQPLIIAKEIQPVVNYSNPQSFWMRISDSMELSLLKDSRFVILSFVLASGYAVSVDFSLILPFFLEVSCYNISFDFTSFKQFFLGKCAFNKG